MSRRTVVLALTAPVLLPVAFVLVAALTVTFALSGGSVDAASVPPGGVTGGQLHNGVPIPPRYLSLLDAAVASAGCAQLTESVLAAQLQQESGYNPRAVSAAGAEGIAQFLPDTWSRWGHDENGDGTASPLDPADAIPAAARYDCAIAKAVASVPGDPAALMLAGYNAGTAAVIAFAGVPPFQETQNYVQAIIALALQWAAVPGLIGAGAGAVPAPGAGVQSTGNAIVDSAVSWTVAQAGSWYHFGGDCTDPFGTDIAHRCDCSSLMQQAYARAGVALPRTAAEQSRVGDPVAVGDIRPGDLVATIGSDGTATEPGHIAMYIGNGWVVEAPFEGAQVHYFPVRGYSDIVAIRRIVTG